MKIAVGLRQASEIHDTDYLRFLHQIGVTHVLGFMPDCDVLPSAKDGYWSLDDLTALVRYYRENGLVMEAIENFLPRHWYKILLDLPGKEQQLEAIKRTVSNIGRAGIPIMGYNFSIGGVSGRHVHPVGRGGAISVGYDPARYPFDDTPLPRSMAWGSNVVDPGAVGTWPPVSREEVRARLDGFLDELLPVCEEAGVRMAAHPEDPPVPVMRGMGRVLISPEDYDRLFERHPSQACAIEFCQGTFTEMGVDVYKTIAHFAAEGRIAYVHLRNVRGTVPSYDETMIDDGDVDIGRALLAYHRAGYDGTLIPDHYPKLSGAVGSHATVAYSIAYLRATMHALGIPVWGDD